jgi:SH3-like domain-containing protein
MARMHGRVLAAALIALVTAPACALEYRSIGGTAAVLYDAPSAKAKKLYVVNQGYPLEVVVVVEGWVKVRDANGEFTWVESKALTDKRTVMVKVPVAAVRQAADEASAIIFQAQQNVILELENVASAGWLRVKHRDGQSGFIKVADVWGV